MNNLKEIIKIVLIFVLLIVFSPAILSLLGFVVKGAFFIIFLVVAIIGVGILYAKYKGNKIKTQYYSNDDSFSQNNNANYSNSQTTEEDSAIDYSDSTIIDVDYQEDDKEDK